MPTPVTPSPANSAIPMDRADGFIALWLLPMRVAQTMMEAGATMMSAALDEGRALADKQVDHSRAHIETVTAAAEEQLGKLDEAAGDTAVNPAALVS